MPLAFFQLQGGRLPAGRREDFRLLPGRLLTGLLRGLMLWGMAVPVEALACPACTARAPESPGGAGVLLLALMGVPFALVGVGIWAARRALRDERTAATPLEQERP
ncbi:hypothetical protein [Corallococcus llansteffanensis]|uniref:Uncharacterized protein n=1 Tax=Corallococcus llansteffanensis TaxID=2316731 RepID=A0A3A8N0Y8_9BACT|nr:hypothetical protein [Corallococcus llansteffanensis]RKH38137.1 hypothetical protein D7V93_41415 [Corallococcus llansteffanensis]